jgi:enoyl-CoA hydratase
VSEGEHRVEYETRSNGTIAVVSMTRERYRNPLSQQMMQELEVAFDRAAEDDDVRMFILRGEGPTFTTGHDLGSPDVTETRAERGRQNMAGNCDRTRGMDIDPHLKWRNIPKPTIAIVQGDCIYAAWMLASAMDVVFAADDAQFLPTNSQYFAVLWEIGARRAKYLMFDNRFLSADEALD